MLIGHPLSEVEHYGIQLIKRGDKRGDNSDWRKLIPSDTDIVNLFYPPKFTPDFPCLVRIGGNGQVGEKYLPNTVFVSKKHAELHDSKAYIHNGISLEEYPYVREKSSSWENFFFMAKAKWKVKNLFDCERAVKQVKKKLHVAGGSKLFNFSPKVKYYGMVKQEDKIPIMKNMDAFLWPVRWHEPFGIAILEAYSQGLPVIASKYGSLPELVNEKTGVLCENYEEFLSVLERKENSFSSDYIRNHLEENFSTKRMALNYLKYYKKVLDGEAINPQPPRTLSDVPPETLLPF